MLMPNKEIVKIVQRIKDYIKFGVTISTAESCTGGMLATYLTEISGSSTYFTTGIVSYSNAAKIKLLSVKKTTLDKFGAVSEEVAKEMAVGSRNIAKSNISISITGIAGPNGASEQKPVGMVCFGISTSFGVKAITYYLKGDRANIRKQACELALKLILSEIA